MDFVRAIDEKIDLHDDKLDKILSKVFKYY